MLYSNISQYKNLNPKHNFWRETCRSELELHNIHSRDLSRSAFEYDSSCRASVTALCQVQINSLLESSWNHSLLNASLFPDELLNKHVKQHRFLRWIQTTKAIGKKTYKEHDKQWFVYTVYRVRAASALPRKRRNLTLLDMRSGIY